MFIQDIFFLHFLVNTYIMVDLMDSYKPLNISIGTVMRNSEMLKLVPDSLKTKKCVSTQLKITLSIKICS